MFFILYSEINAASIGANLGMPEYSYYFVLRGFQKALQAIGDIAIVQNPAEEVDPIFREKQSQGIPCVFLSFSPPNKTLTSLECPTICVFAWEFSNIPYEVWDDEPRNDWRTVFAQIAGAIVLSTDTARVVTSAMGEDYPVCAIPVPVYGTDDRFTPVRQQRNPPASERSLTVDCTVIDSRFYEITAEAFRANVPPTHFRPRVWDGGKVELSFKLGDEGSALLGGFYEPEPWGAWSRIAAPWVLLPFSLVGRCHVSIELSAYGPNINGAVQVGIGGRFVEVVLSESVTVAELEFDLDAPSNLIQFEGLDVSGLPDAADPRSMGIGLRRIWLQRGVSEAAAEVVASAQPLRLAFDGVVYTSVFNPGDDRKNWLELLSGFCYAFRDEPRATLILKMTHRSIGAFLGQFHYMLQRIGKTQCRVVILHGYLSDDSYCELMDITTYYVSASRCEGLCLPLMEFMSRGVPAVSPDNTAMRDYVFAENSFLVSSNLAPSIWPHDTRELIRTLRYRIDWSSLVAAYQQSFLTAIDNAERYQHMSFNAHTVQQQFGSLDVVRERLRKMFDVDSNRFLKFRGAELEGAR